MKSVGATDVWEWSRHFKIQQITKSKHEMPMNLSCWNLWILAGNATNHLAYSLWEITVFLRPLSRVKRALRRGSKSNRGGSGRGSKEWWMGYKPPATVLLIELWLCGSFVGVLC